MNIVLNTNVVSPHTVPLILSLKEILGEDKVKYVFHNSPSDPIRSLGEYSKIAKISIDSRKNIEISREASIESDVLIQNVRDFYVMGSRARRKAPTFYVSERWFKPIRLDALTKSEYAKGTGVAIPGFFKLIFPFVIKRVLKIVKLMNDRQNRFMYLPIGVFAARDMARICGLINGDLSCVFRAPQLEFERHVGGRIWVKGSTPMSVVNRKYCLDKMRMWGYFVAKSDCDTRMGRNVKEQCRVLWIGRLLGCKCVDTIIQAIVGLKNLRKNDVTLPHFVLDIYGKGPEEKRLRELVKENNDVIRFFPYVSYNDVRMIMREHDILVLSSNAFEGWGAVVNEAIEEGIKVLGTYEAGASATVLPEECLFHAGDWRQLMKLLCSKIPSLCPADWSSKSAANKLIKLINVM